MTMGTNMILIDEKATNHIDIVKDVTDNDKKIHLVDEAANIKSQPSPLQAKEKKTNLCSASNGAKVLFATDEWFATADNLLKDTDPVFIDDLYCDEGKVMDGWETKRRREAGHDWCIIKLGNSCIIQPQGIYSIEIDTGYFTGNHVPKVSLEIATIESKTVEESLISSLPGCTERLYKLDGKGIQGTGHTPKEVDLAESAVLNNEEAIVWNELLPMTPLKPGYEETRMHYFTLDKPVTGTHVRVNYYPDGGVARLKLWSSNSSSTSSEGSSDIKTSSSVASFVTATTASSSSTSLSSLLPETNEIESSTSKKKPLFMPIETCDLCTVVQHKKNMEDGSTLVLPSKALQDNDSVIELSSANSGGIGIACSNKHYGIPNNLIQTTYGEDMGDGWETARHPNRPPILIKDPETNLIDSPLNDWSIIKLGTIPCDTKSSTTIGGLISKIVVDTKHFRGNYPESIKIDGCCSFNNDDDVIKSSTSASSSSPNSSDAVVNWFPLISRVRMSPDSEHFFDVCKNQILNSTKHVTHVRVSIYPDGGLSRVRIYCNK